jgi:nucleoid DNA-binding protein
MSNVRKRDIVKKIADEAGTTQKSVLDITQRFMDEIAGILVRGDKVELRGFGVFDVIDKKGGFRRNPRTFERVSVPAKRSVRFRMGKELRDNLENKNESTTTIDVSTNPVGSVES